MTEPSPAEKGDRSASIDITILIINLAVAVDEEIHVSPCKISFGVYSSYDGRFVNRPYQVRWNDVVRYGKRSEIRIYVSS